MPLTATATAARDAAAAWLAAHEPDRARAALRDGLAAGPTARLWSLLGDLEFRAGATYRYRVDTVQRDGSRSVLFESRPVTIPARPLALAQNLPNPMRAGTAISFDLPERGQVRVCGADVGERTTDARRVLGAHGDDFAVDPLARDPGVRARCRGALYRQRSDDRDYRSARLHGLRIRP